MRRLDIQIHFASTNSLGRAGDFWLSIRVVKRHRLRTNTDGKSYLAKVFTLGEREREGAATIIPYINF